MKRLWVNGEQLKQIKKEQDRRAQTDFIRIRE
jgi:hypothetical protein